MSPLTIDLWKFPGVSNDYFSFLSWLAAHFPPDATFVECGTYEGRSAKALGTHGHQVDTYDLQPRGLVSLPPNVRAHTADCFDIPHKTLLAAALIYLDIDWHTGHIETLFYNKLKKIGFTGLLACDDIYLCKDFIPLHNAHYENSKMPDFWNAIDLPKLDTGTRAHDSGMGLVAFSPDITLIG